MPSMQNARHVYLAVETLKLIAANDPAAATYIQRKIAEAGFVLPGNLGASARLMRGIAVGDLDPARGVYLGVVKAAPGLVVHAYAAEDFLRDTKGRQLILNFNETVRELNERNGRRYGNGTDRAVKQAIIDGNYRDGDLLLPSKELLHGRDVRGYTTRAEHNIYALLKAGKLPKVAVGLASGKGDQLWAISGSEHLAYASNVYHVSLPNGGADWYNKRYTGAGVVPVRCYSSPSQASTPKLGG